MFRFILAVFLRQRDVVVTLVVLLALATAVGLRLPRAHRPTPGARLLAVAALWSVAGVLAFTLVPSDGYVEYLRTPWSIGRVASLLHPDRRDLTAWTRSPDGPLNVLLFALPGLLLALLVRRPVRAVAGLVATSVAVEVVQAWSGTRAGTPADVVSNTLGALLGAAVAGLLLHLRR